MDKIINYIVFLGFLYLLYISFKKNRSIFNPSNFFVLIWFINYFILMFFVPSFYLHYVGSAFILLMCSLVYISSHVGMEMKFKHKGKKVEKERITISEVIHELKPISLCLSIFGFLVVPFMIIYIKGDFFSLFNLKYIRNISMYVSYARYREDFQFPLYIQIFLGINYFAALVNGIYFGYLHLKKERKWFYLYFVPVVTSILIAIITTEKAVIIYTVLLFLSSFFVSYNALSEHEFKISLKKVLLFSGLFALTLLLFVYIQMNRRGLSDLNGFTSVVKSFKTYAFGHISAFSVWFNQYLSHPSHLSFGRYTVAGIFSFFHIYERQPGIFTDFSVVSSDPLLTNVYTAFRGLITDFSIYGTCLIMMIFSFFAGISYRYYKDNISAFIYLILFYCMTVLSIFTSLLNYNTLISAFILLGIMFSYYQFYLRKIRRSYHD